MNPNAHPQTGDAPLRIECDYALGALHQTTGDMSPNGWQKAIFYHYCKKLLFGSPFQWTLCHCFRLGVILMTNEWITCSNPKLASKISFKKYIFFSFVQNSYTFFLVSPFFSSFSLSLSIPLSFPPLSGGLCCITHFFLIYSAASLSWITPTQTMDIFLPILHPQPAFH